MFADTLAKLATDAEGELAGLVPVNHLPVPSIKAPAVHTVDHSTSWMGPLIRYLTAGEVPDNRAAAKKLRYQVHRYVMMDEKLYRWGLSMPYLRCVSGTELSAIMHEVHEGFCGDHTAGPSLSKMILCQGYFWPTMKKYCVDYVRKCEQCQRYVKVPRAHPTEITLMNSPWPFAVWGIDLVGSLPTRKGGVKYAIMVVDYYTKWVEADPMNTITSKKALDFFINNIVCQYGLPYKIVSDNGK